MDKQNALQETKKHVMTYRNPKTIQTEEIIDDFLTWVQKEEIPACDNEEEELLLKNKVKEFRQYMQNFLNYEIKKVELDEMLMLLMTLTGIALVAASIILLVG